MLRWYAVLLKPLQDQSYGAYQRGRSGTANQFSERNTNIVHIFSLLEKDDPHQLVYYQTGN